MSADLLAARVKAMEARLLAPGGQTPRPVHEAPPQTPLDALAARARAMEARLLEAYSKRHGSTPPTHQAPLAAIPAGSDEQQTNRDSSRIARRGMECISTLPGDL